MPTLIFNSNYLSVLLPPQDRVSVYCQVGSTFTLRCTYDCWPVRDLLQEWGIDDFPAGPARCAASFLASPHHNPPSPLVARHTGERIKTGELYWIALHPTAQRNEPVAVLCLADSDRLFFGVATSEEDASPLLAGSKSRGAEAWVHVLIEHVERYSEGQTYLTEQVAHLAIHGEAIENWTRALVDPIST